MPVANLQGITVQLEAGSELGMVKSLDNSHSQDIAGTKSDPDLGMENPEVSINAAVEALESTPE